MRFLRQLWQRLIGIRAQPRPEPEAAPDPDQPRNEPRFRPPRNPLEYAFRNIFGTDHSDEVVVMFRRVGPDGTAIQRAEYNFRDERGFKKLRTRTIIITATGGLIEPNQSKGICSICGLHEEEGLIRRCAICGVVLCARDAPVTHEGKPLCPQHFMDYLEHFNTWKNE